MSAETSRDVSLIQDEDVLRKMWQDTEDFGRKKEIRAHMYKIKEARLREFYNSGEATTQTKQTSSSFTESTSKGCDVSTHADSLADQSFLSLKTKEIRDSESPTRDVSYKISGTSRLNDQGWNVVSADESSADGKTHSTTRIATTSGTEPIDGGLSKYAAKTEQKATVFRDGDDKNYTKSVGASAQSVIKQEASGGDENSKFSATSTSTTSSSKYSSEHKSTSGDVDIGSMPKIAQYDSDSLTQKAHTTQHHTSEDVDFESVPRNVVRKIYTTDAPNELEKHPSYVDGNTKVITETKTLPDGSTVTTTRYETKGGKTTTSSSSQSYSTSSRQTSSEQKSSAMSSSKTESHQSVKDSRVYVDDADKNRIIKYTKPQVDTQIVSTDDDGFKNVDQNVSSSTTASSSVKVVKNQQVVRDSKTFDVNVEQSHFDDNAELRRTEDLRLIGRDVHGDKIDTNITVTREDVANKNLINRRNDVKQFHREEIIIPSTERQERPIDQTTHTTVKSTVIKNIGTKYDDQKIVSDDFINVERQHVNNTKLSPKAVELDTTKLTETIRSIAVEYVPTEPSARVPLDKRPKEPLDRISKEREPTKYETPERRQPIKPGKSEFDEKSVPTDGQYDTTYRTDYVNRRISVEVSPTHDAFARSLRAVTPERERTGSTRSLRTSSPTSLRSSTSPDKYVPDRRYRTSPDAHRPISRTSPDKHVPDRRYTTSPDARRTSPDKYLPDRQRTSPNAHRPTSPSKKPPTDKTTPDKFSILTLINTVTDRKRNDDASITRGSIDRRSPDRKPAKIEPYNSDTITKRKETVDVTARQATESIDSSTLTRRSTQTKKTAEPRSRSNSPTSTASEIEYIRTTDVVTDLDVEDSAVTPARSVDSKLVTTTKTMRRNTDDVLLVEQRPSSLDITEKKTKKVTERSSTSPITSPRKQTPSPVKETQPKIKSPSKDVESFPVPKPKEKVFKRTDTYEERCRQILGIPDRKTVEKNITDILITKRPKSPEKKPSPVSSPTREGPRKPALPEAARRPSKSPEKPSGPTKIREFPAQVRKSPEKQSLDRYPEKVKKAKESPKIEEFPAQIRKSPEKKPLDKYATKTKVEKEAPKIQEFPSQIRRSPEKVPLDSYPTKTAPLNEAPKIQEFPSQIRRTPESEPLGAYPSKTKPTKQAPKINEFPSQIRKSTEKKPQEEQAVTIEFGKPSTRDEPVSLDQLPEKPQTGRGAPDICEFQTQVRKISERESMEKYPEISKPPKIAPTINEFPSQVHRTPESGLPEEYPEKSKPGKVSSVIRESPSQKRTSPEKTPEKLKSTPERYIPAKPGNENDSVDTDVKISTTTEDFIIPIFPELPDAGKTKRKIITNEFIDNERVDTDVTLARYNKNTSKIVEVTDSKKLKSTVTNGKDTSSSTSSEDEENEEYTVRESIDVNFQESDESEEYLRRKYARKEVLQQYPEHAQPTKKLPEKTKPTKSAITVQEFPSQTRKSPEKEVLEPYTEKTKPTSNAPSVHESPSQTRKPQQKEPLRPYPETIKPTKGSPTVQEFPSQKRESPEKEPLDPYPEKIKSTKSAPTVQEFPSQVRKSPQKEVAEPYSERPKRKKDALKVQEFPSQVRRPQERELLKPYPEKVNPSRAAPKTQEFPAQVRTHPEKGIQPEDELITVTKTTLLETRVPIDEPLITKKFITTLCRDEEVERAVSHKEGLEKKVHSERVQPIRGILSEDTSLRPNKTVKKDLSKTTDVKKTTEKVAKKESEIVLTKTKKDVTKTAPKSVTPLKKQSSEQTSLKRTTLAKRINEDKFIGETEYTDEYCKTTTKDTKLKQTPAKVTTTRIVTTTSPRKQPTTVNKDAVTVDARTKKTDIYTTRATKIIQNGEVPREVVLTITQTRIKPKDSPKRPTPTKETYVRLTSPVKNHEQLKPKTKLSPKELQHHATIIENEKNVYNAQARKAVLKVSEIKSSRPMTKTVQKTFEMQSPRRHVVSTIINIKPKSKPETIRRPMEKTITTTKTTKLNPKVTVTAKTVKQSSQTSRAKPIQNGHVPSDEDTEDSESEVVEQVQETYTAVTKTESKDKITRTVSDQIIKTPRNTPTRGTSKPDTILTSKAPPERKPNCITTKSILIENAVADEREIIVDLKRSKSSREETPDRICPFPVPTNEDSGTPRYPDHISEPEEGKPTKPKRLSDIPLTESEDVTEFSRITEVRQNKADDFWLSVNEKVSKLSQDQVRNKTAVEVEKVKTNVEDQDDCHLSVSDKVSKFITTAENLTVQRPKSPRPKGADSETPVSVSQKVSHFISTAEKVQRATKPTDGVAPKVPRPNLTDVDENIRSDECLLSVSDKVTKFITTAEKLTTSDYKKPVSLSKLEPISKKEPTQPKQGSPQDVITECSLTKLEPTGRKEPIPRPRLPSPNKDTLDFIATEKEEETYNRRSVSPGKSPSRDSPSRKPHEPAPVKHTETSPIRQERVSPIRRAESSPIRQVESPKHQTPDRRPSNLYPKKPTEDITKTTRRSSIEPSDTPRSSRRTSQDEPKTVLSPTGRLRSTETIKKAKALFENISKEQEILKQRDILSRPSVFESRKQRKPEEETNIKPKPKGDVKLTDIGVEKRRKDVATRLTYDDEDELVTKTSIYKTSLDTDDTLRSTRLIMEGLRSSSSPEKVQVKSRSRDSTPEGDIPHYMTPLDRTIRERSPHYENIKQMEDSMTKSTSSAHEADATDTKTTTKFGVTLRRTDSGRTITTTRRKSSTASVDQQGTELDIEDIFDLEFLEAMLEKVVGYDIRRRIRAQIRIVKRLIEENKLDIVITKKTKKTTSPTRETSQRRTDKSPEKFTTKPNEKRSTEYQSSYTRKYSSDSKPVDNKSYQHSELISRSGTVEKSTEYQSSYAYNERRATSDIRSERRSSSPEYKTTGSTSPDSKRSQSPEKSRSSPERKTSKTESSRVFQAELKKTKPVSKTMASEKPEWVTQRTLRKVSETSAPIKKVVTTTKTTTRKKESRSSSPTKESRHTDVITSSYGVGPMDENGSPLFGLKALRAQNKSEKTKVQGTVIRSHYYAENGHEPVGEISVTKYSTDSKDLGKEHVTKEKGIASVTTTQKFGYKGTPSLKTISKKKQITDADEDTRTSTRTSKVTRRGSVKEMSQKFIENAVETSKSERQSSYPKAGLILRTSSFKDTASSGTGSSREGSPGARETCETVTTVRTSKSSSETADTFLSNKSRVSGIQEVITRMKNEEVEEGESQEETEARNLLNKFIGSQVILSGMESHVSSPGSNVRTTTTKITTTSSDGGKPKTVTRTFTHPITEELLETVWDEQTLKLLLEQSTDYEDRRIIRARLRLVMAEQEACAELVDKASEETGKRETGSIQGESLLLPLLQGLLGAPEKEQTADSGTESGEDLRSGLILEVQNALNKLSTSLKNDSNDMSSERRDSLLQLVSRLQLGLSTQLTPSSSSERRSSLQGRFSKRKQRPNRHTVGVTSEELEDARRLMEEIAFRNNIIDSKVDAVEYSPLQKQHSEGSVAQTAPFKPLKHQKVKPVKNLTAKPYISSGNTSQSQSGTSSTVETPTETSESLDFLTSPEKSQTDIPQNEVVLRDKKPQHAYHQSISLELEKPQVAQKRPLSQTVSLDYSRDVNIISVQKAVTQAAAIKQLSQLKSDVSESTQDSETDDDPVTVKTVPQQTDIPKIPETPPAPNPIQPDLILQTNPVYKQPDNSESENDDNSSQYNTLDSEKANRFNSKKLKMKRANTIDIPKPLKYYECDDESEGDHELEFNTRRNSYLALRGPISVGKIKAEKKVPEFEPKTESDKKFVAFLNKHTETSNSNKSSIWAKQENTGNWSNKFGHIKTAFEKVGSEKNTGTNSARNFWKSADDAVTAGRVSHVGPKISRQSARNLQQMFEEKQKQSLQRNSWSGSDANSQQKTPWPGLGANNSKNIVTGSLKVDTKMFEVNKNVVKVVPQPNPVNKFSHAPMSAFRPVAKKLETPQATKPLDVVKTKTVERPQPIKPQSLDVPSSVVKTNIADSQSSTPESALYLYSPKPLSPQSELTSPVPNSTPWSCVRMGDGGRVLSIAASKFQNLPQQQDQVTPRRLSKDKIAIPPALQQPSQSERLTAPYLVKSLGQSNFVRKLSGQYDNLEGKNTYSMQTAIKHSQSPGFYNQQTHIVPPKQFPPGQYYSAQLPQPQQFLPPCQNDATQFSQSEQNIPQPKVYNAAYTVTTQQFNLPQNRDSEPQIWKNGGGNDDWNYQNGNTYPQYGPQHNYSQPQVYQKQLPNQSENSQPEYTSSYQFRPQVNQLNQRTPNQTDVHSNDGSIQQEQFVARTQPSEPFDSFLQSYPTSQQHFTPNQQKYAKNQQHSPENQQHYLRNQQRVSANQHNSADQDPQLYSANQRHSFSNQQQQPSSVQNYTQNGHHSLQQEHYPRIQRSSTDEHYAESPELYPTNQEPFFTNLQQTSPEPLKIFDYPSPQQPPATRPVFQTQSSHESVKEYTAVSSRVMSGPVSQQAVTVQQKSPKNRDQHDMDAAFNLRTSLEKFSKMEPKQLQPKHQLSSQSFRIKSAVEKPRMEHRNSLPEDNAPSESSHIVYNNVSSRPTQIKAAPNFYVNDKPMSLESLEINERGESVLTSKFHIPVKSVSRNAPQLPTPGQILSKSESWHKICQGGATSTTNKPSSRATSNTRTITKSKSSHTLAVPKQFEAGMSKSEMQEKKRTIEAYFGESKAKSETKTETKKSAINRVKTSHKVSTQRQSSSSEKVTTQRTFSEGPVTTSQVTTRVASQQQIPKKPLSPFAKFKQLDKQNSLNSPPSTPHTPTSGGPLFKFTDPALSRSASTVKERLLQWAQIKTKEYENIQLDNFSTSWADGLAFCALIHHFLPDAFNYQELTAKNRRHNFTLAFRVADEKADIAPLLDVDDMVATRKPDWKCVFTYVQSIYRRFKDED